MVQLMPLPPHYVLISINVQTGLIFLVPAYPGCPGKEDVKVGVFCFWGLIFNKFKE